MRSLVYRVAPLVVALATVAASCGGDDAPQASDAEIQEFRSAVDGLCQSANTLGRGETSAARRTFGNQTHAYLHELIDRVEPLDRAAATELLEAKHAVEALLKDPAFYGDKEASKRLDDLHNAMIRVGAVVGLPEVGCGA